jgi:hypothetical protein
VPCKATPIEDLARCPLILMRNSRPLPLPINTTLNTSNGGGSFLEGGREVQFFVLSERQGKERKENKGGILNKRRTEGRQRSFETEGGKYKHTNTTKDRHLLTEGAKETKEKKQRRNSREEEEQPQQTPPPNQPPAPPSAHLPKLIVRGNSSPYPTFVAHLLACRTCTVHVLQARN